MLQIVEKQLQKLRQENPVLLAETTNLSDYAIMELLKFVLGDCYFVWSKRLYRQWSGLPMGGRLSPVLAGIFMEEIEERALAACPVKPRLYKRYVDDVVVVWDSETGTYHMLLDLLNAQHSDITLTIEEEVAGSLPFLDLLITRPTFSETLRCAYSLAIYCKPMHGNRYIHFESLHPFTLK